MRSCEGLLIFIRSHKEVFLEIRFWVVFAKVPEVRELVAPLSDLTEQEVFESPVPFGTTV
jgi:hypothetical protein